jgi:cupin fold WbuC family metalloprotein
MNLRQLNAEVFIAADAIVRCGDAEIEFLKRQAQASPRKRARICAHKKNEDPLHEMLIVIAAASYIRPHRHIAKSESFHIIEGEVDVAVFDDAGALTEVIALGARESGRNFFYRLSHSAFHTLLVRSDFLVMHEVTNGPFDPAGSMLADFAPAENDPAAAREYMQRLSAQVARRLGQPTA